MPVYTTSPLKYHAEPETKSISLSRTQIEDVDRSDFGQKGATAFQRLTHFAQKDISLCR